LFWTRLASIERLGRGVLGQARAAENTQATDCRGACWRFHAARDRGYFETMGTLIETVIFDGDPRTAADRRLLASRRFSR